MAYSGHKSWLLWARSRCYEPGPVARAARLVTKVSFVRCYIYIHMASSLGLYSGHKRWLLWARSRCYGQVPLLGPVVTPYGRKTLRGTSLTPMPNLVPIRQLVSACTARESEKVSANSARASLPQWCCARRDARADDIINIFDFPDLILACI